MKTKMNEEVVVHPGKKATHAEVEAARVSVEVIAAYYVAKAEEKKMKTTNIEILVVGGGAASGVVNPAIEVRNFGPLSDWTKVKATVHRAAALYFERAPAREGWEMKDFAAYVDNSADSAGYFVLEMCDGASAKDGVAFLCEIATALRLTV